MTEQVWIIEYFHEMEATCTVRHITDSEEAALDYLKTRPFGKLKDWTITEQTLTRTNVPEDCESAEAPYKCSNPHCSICGCP